MEQGKEPKRTRGKFKRNTKYEKPEVEERVVSLRGDGKTWGEVADIVGGEIDEPNMSNEVAKTIHMRAMSKTITTEKRVGKKFADYTDNLNKMYGTAINTLNRWINAADKLSEQMELAVDDGKIEAIQAYGVLLKTAPQMKAISSEIRDYMKFQIDQQDRIKTEQKALVWDESQMLDYMDKYLNQLEKEGKIRWIKPKI